MSTGNEISKGVSATDYEQQVKRLKRNLFDCQEAAKGLAQQATKAEAERDALAAELAELERQEPVVKYSGKRLTPEGTKEMWGYLLSEVEPRENQELYARPVPAEPVNVDFGMRGENMFFQIGNQSFLLDYKPEEQGEFEFMKAMLLSAFSRITHGVKTEIQPVDARLLNVSTGKLGHINAGLCPDSINGPDSRDPACPACRAIAEADADSKLACALHGTHGAGHETEWVKEQIHRQAESDVLSDLLGSLKEVCETFSSTNRLWKDTAVHVMAQRSIARAEAALSSSDDTPPSAEERRLRRMLCRQRHGLSAYMDDGEATFGGDEFQRPTDYLRESLDSIEQAWIEAGLKQAALAEPQPDADGWIPWPGGECPVLNMSRVDVVHRNGDIFLDRFAGYAQAKTWTHDDHPRDIIAYRVVEAQP